MIIVCSIDDVRKYGQGKIMRASIGESRGMAQYTAPGAECWYPTKELVWGHKYKGMSDAAYIAGYKALLRQRWPQIVAWCRSLTATEDVTLLCYCREGEFCHRRIMAKLIAYLRPDLEVVVH